MRGLSSVGERTCTAEHGKRPRWEPVVRMDRAISGRVSAGEMGVRRGLRPVRFSALGFRERKEGRGGNERKNFKQRMPAGQQ